MISSNYEPDLISVLKLQQHKPVIYQRILYIYHLKTTTLINYYVYVVCIC